MENERMVTLAVQMCSRQEYTMTVSENHAFRSMRIWSGDEYEFLEIHTLSTRGDMQYTRMYKFACDQIESMIIIDAKVESIAPAA